MSDTHIVLRTSDVFVKKKYIYNFKINLNLLNIQYVKLLY